MILEISLWAKTGVPKTLVKRKFHLHSLYFPQNKLMLTESRGEFRDLHSIFRLCVLRYCSNLLQQISNAFEFFISHFFMSSKLMKKKLSKWIQYYGGS